MSREMVSRQAHSTSSLSPDNHHFNRNGRPNYDGAPPQNRPFQEGYPPRNFDSMGPSQHNRPNLSQPPNFNQGPPSNRPDFYPPSQNNPSYQSHSTRSGGRPSRFSDRQDDYDDDQPLTKPNFSLPNRTPTTTPLYFNQPTNPTFSQARPPPLASTFSSQQPPPPNMMQPGGPAQNQPPSQFAWGNQQPGGANAYMNQTLASLAANDQQGPNMSGPPSTNSFYGNNNDFHRQPPPSSSNPYYPGATHPSQPGGKQPLPNGKPLSFDPLITQCRFVCCLCSPIQFLSDAFATTSTAVRDRRQCGSQRQFHRSVATVLSTMLVCPSLPSSSSQCRTISPR